MWLFTFVLFNYLLFTFCVVYCYVLFICLLLFYPDALQFFLVTTFVYAKCLNVFVRRVICQNSQLTNQLPPSIGVPLAK